MKMHLDWLQKHIWDFNSFTTGTALIGMDTDFITEVNGHFLVIEFKVPGLENQKPKGQQILYQRLVELGCFTVVYAYGYADKEEIRRIEIFTKDRNYSIKNGSLVRLRKLCLNWEKRMKKKPKPKFLDLRHIQFKEID
jgi:hypothetical protein